MADPKELRPQTTGSFTSPPSQMSDHSTDTRQSSAEEPREMASSEELVNTQSTNAQGQAAIACLQLQMKELFEELKNISDRIGYMEANFVHRTDVLHTGLKNALQDLDHLKGTSKSSKAASASLGDGVSKMPARRAQITYRSAATQTEAPRAPRSPPKAVEAINLFRCGACPATFPTSKQLVSHVERGKHANANKPARAGNRPAARHICIVCKKTFQTGPDLQLHLKLTNHLRQNVKAQKNDEKAPPTGRKATEDLAVKPAEKLIDI